MTDADCPFCNPAPGRVFCEGRPVKDLWDPFPVSPVRAALAPREESHD